MNNVLYLLILFFTRLIKKVVSNSNLSKYFLIIIFLFAENTQIRCDTTAGENTGEDTTAGENTGEDTTAGENTGEDTTAGENKGEDTTAGENKGEDTTAGENTGDDTTAGENTGEDTTGGNTTGTSVTNHKNETLPDDSLDNPIPINENDPRKVAFLGFSDFEKLTKKEDGYYIAIIIAWITRLSGIRKYGNMTMKVTISNNIRLRFLEEEETDAVCEPLTDNRDTIPFKCTIKSKIEIDSLEADPSRISIPGVKSDDLKISPHAEEQMNNLQEQDQKTLKIFEEGKLLYRRLHNSTLTQNDNDFILKGELDKSDFPNGKLFLTLPKKNSEEKVNATCEFTKSKEEEGNILKCEYPKDTVDTPLDGKVATNDTGNSLLTIVMKDPNSNLKHVNDNGGINNYSRQKSSDGGLSGGAIAGIVIACAVALIAAAITAVVCKAPAKPPLQEESTLGVNTNNVIVN